MSVCRDQIPYTHFMGGPDVWDDLSRALAIEWRHQENSRCRCGVPFSDWYLDDGTPDEDAYKVEKYLCPGCSQLDGLDVSKEPKGTRKRLVPVWAAARWRNYRRG